MNMVRAGGAVAVGSLLICGVSVLAEDISVTTYYPSPRGVYEQLQTTKATSLATDVANPGNVGIGVMATTAVNKLTVVGGVSIGDAATYAVAPAPTNGLIVEGNVGIGTPNPVNQLGVGGGASIGNAYTNDAAPANGLIVQGNVVIGASTAPTGTNYQLFVRGGNAVNSPGIGVHGGIDISGQYSCGQGIDVSEHIAGSPALQQPLQPGDVVVVDAWRDETITLTAKAYDPSVAGIVATQPGVLLGAQLDGHAIALVGRVPTKVTTENGPIHRGDLLVTASKPGYAMRGDPKRIRAGTVIGKALGELERGEGVVTVLVNLQ